MSTYARLLVVLAVTALCLGLAAHAVVIPYPSAALGGATDYRLSDNAENPYPTTGTGGGPHGSLYTSATLNNGVFTVQGKSAAYSSDVRPAGRVTVSGLTVSSGNVVIAGYFPRDTVVRLTQVSGTVSASTPFVDMTGLVSGNQVVVEVSDATVAWPAAASTPTTQVLLRIPPTTSGNSAVFALDVDLTRAAAVVNAVATSASFSMTVTENSVVAADYITCSGCASGIIYVPAAAMYALSGGLIRASHIRITSTTTATPAILNTDNSPVSSNGGLIVVENVSASTVNVFGGAASSTGAAGVVLRYLNVNAIGSTLDSAVTYAGVSVANNAAELSGATAVTSGCPTACLNGGTLANAAESCVCTCPAATATATYYQNFCTVMSDPLASFVPTGCMDGCTLCLNETACTTCSSDYVLNPTTAVCEQAPQPCPANCKTCSAAGLCSVCNDGYAISNTGACVRCAVANCKTCSATNPNTCSVCTGDTAPVNNVCPITCTDANCLSCPSTPGVCARCADGYGLVNGACQACADPNCRQCNSDANVCTACNDGYLVQGTGCAADSSSNTCNVIDCLECDSTDPSRCKQCVDGKIVDSVTGKCITSGSCSVPNCDKCSATSAAVCEQCSTGYTPSASGDTCTLTNPSTCTVPNCATCTTGNPNSCAYCNSGYYPSNGQCVLVGSCYVGKCAQCMLRDSTKCSNCMSGYLISSTYTCISQHVNANAAAAPHSLWVAAAVLLASALTYLA